MGDIHQFPEFKAPDAAQHQFQPYESNGGSIVAIAGDNFAVIAADTRLSLGYNILSRKESHLLQLTSKAVLGSCGNSADSEALDAAVKSQILRYANKHEHREMSVNALSQLLSTMMYSRRFFPYYVSNVLAGVDEGKGYVYTYDSVGWVEKNLYGTGGSAAPLLHPILDNQVGLKNMKEKPDTPMTIQRAVDLITDAFVSAAEREVHTGDSIEMAIITEDGVVKREIPLRKD